jgi:hypothetical protein
MQNAECRMGKKARSKKPEARIEKTFFWLVATGF